MTLQGGVLGDEVLGQGDMCSRRWPHDSWVTFPWHIFGGWGRVSGVWCVVMGKGREGRGSSGGYGGYGDDGMVVVGIPGF